MNLARPWLLPGSQIATVVLGLLALAVVKGNFVPDVLMDIAFPLAFTILFLAGITRMLRDRRRLDRSGATDSALVIGTVLCGIFMILTLGITIWWHFFFNWPGF